MFGFTVDRHVAAPPDVVFARASDFRRAPETIAAIVKMEMLTDGPVRVGTRFRETRVLFGRAATEEMTVTALEPPKRYTLAAESHGSRYHTELSFAPDGQGTRVTMTFAATPVTFMARVMSVLMRPMMKSMVKMCAKDLDDLKAAIESDRNAGLGASA
jgi:carbon monoxide dehydrogenase subunit G